MGDVDVRKQAGLLEDLASHFVEGPWRYTRDTRIKHIRYEGDWSGYDHPLQRVKRWLDDYLPGGRDTWVAREGRRLAWRHPIIHARVSLRTPTHAPDGSLNRGAVIVHWEETGEYLEMVQPDVGILLAQWMLDEPESPHAIRIAEKLAEISAHSGEEEDDDDDQ